MVEFCSKCKCSLPYADLEIRDGVVELGRDYICPECKKPASSREKNSGEPEEVAELIIKKGKIEQPG